MLRNRLGKFWWVSFVQRLGSPTCQARMVQSPPAENNWPLCDENVRECTPSAGSCPLRTSVGAKSESSSQLLLLRIKPTLGHRLQTAMSPEWYGAVNMEQRSLQGRASAPRPQYGSPGGTGSRGASMHGWCCQLMRTTAAPHLQQAKDDGEHGVGVSLEELCALAALGVPSPNDAACPTGVQHSAPVGDHQRMDQVQPPNPGRYPV
eukprot:CAMPEP_0117674070 /NCGR_PEP_ID=MMETSP0804-20121206/14830_1 /TAXON_ID=1074897 /ORGANISM="Tetraselmis astigmatica, Strain CCMP880" /LENGTH=205 /DNA_ID=CAMNT_0005482891 /DNA_START=332 /DNA_END=951 /DNA_ORIENTATION=-